MLVLVNPIQEAVPRGFAPIVGTQSSLAEIKRASAATVLFTRCSQGWQVSGPDASEVSFCTGLPINSYRRQGNYSSRLVVSLPAIDAVVSRLLDCGNPVALLDESTGELTAHSPAPVWSDPAEATAWVNEQLSQPVIAVASQPTLTSYCQLAGAAGDLGDFGPVGTNQDEIDVPF